MRDSCLPEIVTIIVVILIVSVLMVAALKGCEGHDDTFWNGGHCDNCSSAWEYEQAVGHGYTTSYIYVCKNCGKRIELFEVR